MPGGPGHTPHAGRRPKIGSQASVVGITQVAVTSVNGVAEIAHPCKEVMRVLAGRFIGNTASVKVVEQIGSPTRVWAGT